MTMPLRRKRRTGRYLAKMLLFGLAAAVAVMGPTTVPRVAAQTNGSVSGKVTDANGNPVAGLRVGIFALEQAFAQTDASGNYTINTVPTAAGPYDVQLLAPCTKDQSKRVTVDGAETVNFTIPAGADKGAGYVCSLSTFPYIAGTSDFGVTGDDATSYSGLPFSFPFAGSSYDQVYVSTNGSLNFSATNVGFRNTSLPSDAAAKASINPFWDDLVVDEDANVAVADGGVSPNRYHVIEWQNVTFDADLSKRVSFEVVLFETGRIVLNYKDLSVLPENQLERGVSATVGLVNAQGTAALQRSFKQPYLDNGLALEFNPAPK